MITTPMSTATPPDVPALLAGRRRILVTGGGGFIGGAVVRRLLTDSEALVFNLDKCGYASDLTSIEQVLAELGDRASTPGGNSRHQLLRVDLTDAEATAEAVRQADPDLVMHLAAESPMDRSIEGPGACGSTSSPDCSKIASNVNGTFHLLHAVRAHWQQPCPSELANTPKPGVSPG